MPWLAGVGWVPMPICSRCDGQFAELMASKCGHLARLQRDLDQSPPRPLRAGAASATASDDDTDVPAPGNSGRLVAHSAYAFSFFAVAASPRRGRRALVSCILCVDTQLTRSLVAAARKRPVSPVAAHGLTSAASPTTSPRKRAAVLPRPVFAAPCDAAADSDSEATTAGLVLVVVCAVR
jgi:hypothetical protein